MLLYGSARRPPPARRCRGNRDVINYVTDDVTAGFPHQRTCGPRRYSISDYMRCLGNQVSNFSPRHWSYVDVSLDADLGEKKAKITLPPPQIVTMLATSARLA